MKTKLMLAAAVIVAAAAMVSAQTYSNRGAWNANEAYSGDYKNFRGDTVSHGTYDGKTLWWWAKFAPASTDEPGALGALGGTSPWVMVNSLSAAQNGGTVNYQWKGKGGAGSGPIVATWRNGAKGAYSMTHDDLGTLPFDKSVLPGLQLAGETDSQGNKKYERIKQSWGVVASKMDEDEWAAARKMVSEGHEIFNHSMNHTSAADQYQWFYPTQTVPDWDPGIPYEIRGLKVVGTWGNPNVKMEWPWSEVVTVESNMVSVTGPGYWTQNAITSGADVTVTAKSGTEQIMVNGRPMYVKYTKKAYNKVGDVFYDLEGNELDIGGGGTVVNEGTLAATDAGWMDEMMLDKYGENGWNGHTSQPQNNWWVNPVDVPAGCTQPDWSDGGKDPTGNCSNKWPCDATVPCKADQGAPAMIVKAFTLKAWTSAEMKVEMEDANAMINQNVYDKITCPGKYFAVGKKSEYFGYPYDAYSLATHDKLGQHGIAMGRGGSKTSAVMKGDFFHPYAIDFDAFYINRTDWNVNKGSAEGYTYGGAIGNDHVWLGVNELVQKCIDQNGYMIREFHNVAKLPGESWHDGSNDNPNGWPINSSGLEKGGWWGGIAQHQLREHYDFLNQKIDAFDLAVYTPSEAIKYRLTANATTGALLSGSGSEYTLTPQITGSLDEKYQDEISVIVKIDGADKMNVEYEDYTDGNGRVSPRLAPVNLGGGEWSINFNPFKGVVKLYPGQDFVDPEFRGEIPDEYPCPGWDGFGDNPCEATSIVKDVKARQINSFAFTGLQNGQINLRLTAGAYTVSLYNLQGRMISAKSFNAVNGINATGLKTSNLAKGMLILRVKDAKGANVLQNKIMIK